MVFFIHNLRHFAFCKLRNSFVYFVSILSCVLFVRLFCFGFVHEKKHSLGFYFTFSYLHAKEKKKTIKINNQSHICTFITTTKVIMHLFSSTDLTVSFFICCIFCVVDEITSVNQPFDMHKNLYRMTHAKQQKRIEE